jgi:hypothetical protein
MLICLSRDRLWVKKVFIVEGGLRIRSLEEQGCTGGIAFSQPDTGWIVLFHSFTDPSESIPAVDEKNSTNSSYCIPSTSQDQTQSREMTQ